MGANDIIALLPVIVLGGAIVIVLLLVAFVHDTRFILVAALLALAAPLLTLPYSLALSPRPVTALMRFDGFGVFFTGLLLATTLGVAAVSSDYLLRRSRGEVLRFGEYYLLLLLAALGGIVLVVSDHFATFFIGLELLSVSLFALIAYPAQPEQPLEAGIKYLILISVASSLVLLGMAFIYLATGTLSFTQMAQPEGRAIPPLYSSAGAVLLLAGIGLKLSLVPFHMWTPDVYQGAPAPVSAFLATVSKAAVFAVLVRFFLLGNLISEPLLVSILALIAIASMLAGNLLALFQTNVKRILAYSSIAHLGYLLVAFLAAGPFALEAVTYYLVGYVVMTLGAFAVVTQLSVEREEDVDDLTAYRGLLWRRPWLAATFILMLLSLAGIPLTIGFIAKFYAVAAAVGAALWLLLIVLIVGSAIGLFYYLRVVLALLLPVTMQTATGGGAEAAVAGNVVLALLVVLLLGLGLYPEPLITLIRTIALSAA